MAVFPFVLELLYAFPRAQWKAPRLEQHSPQVLPHEEAGGWRVQQQENKKEQSTHDNNMALDSFRCVVNKRRRRRRCAANESKRKPREWLAKAALYHTLCLKFAAGCAEKNQMGRQLMWAVI